MKTHDDRHKDINIKLKARQSQFLVTLVTLLALAGSVLIAALYSNSMLSSKSSSSDAIPGMQMNSN